MNLYRVVIILFLSLLLVASYSIASTNPLRHQARTEFPPSVKTVGQATQYLLEPLGYVLVVSGPVPLEAREVAQRSVAAQARTGAVMPIEEALLLLIGDKYRLVVDHKNRLVTFECLPGGDES